MDTTIAKDIGLTNWQPFSFPIHALPPLAVWITQL